MDSRSADMSKIAGPDSMAPPSRRPGPGNASYAAAASTATAAPSHPQPQPPSQSQSQSQSQSNNAAASARMPSTDGAPAKKKRHRAGKKRRNRRQSFIAPSDTNVETDQEQQRPSLMESHRSSANQASFYRLQSAARSNTSLESQALLDHRDQQPLRTRRQSIKESLFASRANASPYAHRSSSHRPSYNNSLQPSSPIKSRAIRSHRIDEDSDDDDHNINDRTPLIPSSYRDHDRPTTNRTNSSHMAYGTRRRPSAPSVASSKKSRRAGHRHAASEDEDFDVNNPPSVPGSPKLGTLDDVMIAENFSNERSPGHREAIIDIDRNVSSDAFASSSSSPDRAEGRRHTLSHPAENDVCYPADVDMSVIGEEEFQRPDDGSRTRDRRRRRRRWPDLSYLEEWSLEEKEERQQEHLRAKKISEPVLVGGRLRPKNPAWHREEDDSPYRFTYFNETFDGTIHSRTISELTQADGEPTFRELFVPEPIMLSSSESESDTDNELAHQVSTTESGRQSRLDTNSGTKTRETSGSATPAQSHTPKQEKQKQKRSGAKPTWWLDVLSPTEAEMKVISKAFGIHQLTAEDILMQEPREKVELFQHYYFVNYRSFEQDKDSEEYMDPVNMFVVVFREGVISVSHTSYQAASSFKHANSSEVPFLNDASSRKRTSSHSTAQRLHVTNGGLDVIRHH